MMLGVSAAPTVAFVLTHHARSGHGLSASIDITRGNNMARIEMTDENEDTLFSIFNTTQDLQRQILRLVSRGFISEAALQELRWKSEGIAKEIGDLQNTAPAD